jgi:cell division protease FtsH
LGYRYANSDPDGRYAIVKEIITDPHLACILQHTQSTGDESFLSKLKLYVLCAPHLEVGGWGNNGCVIEVSGRKILTAEKRGTWLALAATDKTGREAILKVHTRNVPLAKDASLNELAASTPGFSGADLRNLVNEAALLAARRSQNEVHQKDFLDSLEKIVLGPERPLLLSRADKERIAYHEGGHAILGLVVPGADPVNRVTIVPRGQALGVTYQRPDSDRYNYPEAYLRARIVGMLGGRAAEEIVYGTKTTGAESDIEQATGLARRMVTRWKMSDRIGLVQLAPRENPYPHGSGGYTGDKPFSDATGEAIDAEVQKIIGVAMRKPSDS